MPNKSKVETDIRITVAAGLFATYTRDAKEIADKLNTTERNIYRWAERARWKEVLDTLGYTGERHFRVRPARDMQASPDFEKARQAYRAAQDQGVPKHKLASTVGEQIGIKSERVREWARTFGWNA